MRMFTRLVPSESHLRLIVHITSKMDIVCDEFSQKVCFVSFMLSLS